MDRKVQQPSAPPWKPDATTPRDRHRLEGLEPDNLLAFIALIGLLRALEAARPGAGPRRPNPRSRVMPPYLFLAFRRLPLRIASKMRSFAAAGDRGWLSC